MKSVLKAKTVSILLILISIDFIYSGCCGCRVRGKSSDKVGDSSKEKKHKKSHGELSKGTIRKGPIITPPQRKNEEVKKIVINSDLRGRENTPDKSRISLDLSGSSLTNSFVVSRINREKKHLPNYIVNETSLVNNNYNTRQDNDNITGMSCDIIQKDKISKDNELFSEGDALAKSMKNIDVNHTLDSDNIYVDAINPKTSIGGKGKTNSVSNSNKNGEMNSNETSKHFGDYLADSVNIYNNTFRDYDDF